MVILRQLMQARLLLLLLRLKVWQWVFPLLLDKRAHLRTHGSIAVRFPRAEAARVEGQELADDAGSVPVAVAADLVVRGKELSRG